MRNELQHNIADASMLKQIEDLVFDLLNKIEETFGVDSSQHDKMKSDMKDEFQSIKDMEVKDAEVELIVQEASFSTRAKDRIRKDREGHVVALSSTGIKIKRKNISLPFTFQVEESTSELGSEISYQELLERPTNFLLLQGAFGSGKTTLLRAIFDKWTRVKDNKITLNQLEHYDVVALIESKAVDKSTTLVDVLMSQYPEIFRSGTSLESIMKALQKLKVLVLIDGYGQHSQYSSALINDVIKCQRQCNSIKVVVADREAPVLELQTNLEGKGLNCEVVIMKLSDKEEFLKSIAKNLSGAKQLVKTFNNFHSDFTDAFDTVKQLALFCELFIQSPDTVKAWKSERDAFLLINKLYLQDIVENIKDKPNGLHPDLIASRLIENLSDFCLTLRVKGMSSMSTNLLQNFLNSIEDKLLKNVESYLNLLLSCIIYPKRRGIQSVHGVEYHFHSSSIQEYFCSSAIVKSMKKSKSSPNSSFEEVVRQITDCQITDIERYANIIKYVILKLNDNGCLDNYQKMLTDVLLKIYPKFPYCAEVVSASKNSVAVAKFMIEVLNHKGGTKWNITQPRHLQPATMMLEKIEPNVVKRILVAQVTKASSDYYSDLSEFLKALSGHTDTEIGIDLRYSHDEYEPVDKVVEAMATVNFRCKLYAFVGCVMEQESLSILNSCQKTDGCGMLLSWPSPDHNWSALHHWDAALMSFTVQYTEADVPCKPLPLGKDGDAPLLSVKGCSAQTHQRLTQIIKDLAPSHIKEFKGVILRDCNLSDEVLSSAVNSLQSEGYRTDCTYDVSRPEKLTKDNRSCVNGFFPSHTHEGNSTCYRLHLTNRSYPVLGEGNSDEPEDDAASFISALGQQKEMDRNFKNIFRYYKDKLHNRRPEVDVASIICDLGQQEVDNNLFKNIITTYKTEVDKGAIDAASFVRALSRREQVDFQHCTDVEAATLAAALTATPPAAATTTATAGAAATATTERVAATLVAAESATAAATSASAAAATPAARAVATPAAADSAAATPASAATPVARAAAEATESVITPTEARAAAKTAATFPQGGVWTVNSRITARAAVLAAAERKKKPNRLFFVFPESGQNVLTLSDLSDVLRASTEGCEVTLRCLDAFFGCNKEGIVECNRRLALVKKYKMRLTDFYGQFDSDGLSELPHTIDNLGLAITNIDDDATVKAWKPWTGLEYLHVCISGAVTPAQLSPLLAGPVTGLHLHFWGTKDDGVDDIVKYIDSIFPDENKWFNLFFPNCLLSLSGASRLPQLLEGRCVYRIDIEAPSTWQQSHRDKLTAMLKKAIGSDVLSGVTYNMSWLRKY